MLDLVVEQGQIQVHISEPGKTLGAEFWAKRAAGRIMSVSDSAPQPIRDQARAFKNELETIIVGAMKTAIYEQKMNDAYRVERVSAEAAQIIREG